MENTIENARELFADEVGINAALGYGDIDAGIIPDMLVKYCSKITTHKDQRIAELEKENADLRRALSECKARARIGVSPENR